MHATNLMPRLDAAISAYLTHYRALRRGYDQEEWVLGLMRTFLVRQGAADLDRESFEQWRNTFCHLHPNSRHTNGSFIIFADIDAASNQAVSYLSWTVYRIAAKGDTSLFK